MLLLDILTEIYQLFYEEFMEKQVIADKKYNWKIFTNKGDIAYKEYLKGNENLIKNHNIVTNGELEIEFSLSLAKIFFNFSQQGKALDVGCGSGHMAQCFKKIGFDTTGFDLSEDAVEIAKINFPEINFIVGDGTMPKKYFEGQSFDLIHIREFHPFTRINDFEYQIKIIKDYINILNEEGLIIITHARRGGGMNYSSLEIEKIKQFYQQSTVRTAGPFFYFLFKHLTIFPTHRRIIKIVSSITGVLQLITHQRWIEIFLIYKNPVTNRIKETKILNI